MDEEETSRLWFMYKRRRGSRWKTLLCKNMAHRQRLIDKFDLKVWSWWAPT